MELWLHGMCVLLRCSYKYDAFGNLYRKLCSNGDSYTYLMDPFGPYGPDVIAEVGKTIDSISWNLHMYVLRNCTVYTRKNCLQISGGTVTYFVHSMEHGLLAAFDNNRAEWYYQFNGDK